MKDRNEPAFPNTTSTLQNIPASAGMSLRDWFAGQALVGYLSSHLRETTEWAVIAADAYHMADAMLAERKRQEDDR